MVYKINVKDKIKISENINVFKKAKLYYKKRPIILIINIFLAIASVFIHPAISVLIGLIGLFVLPAWKEKQLK